MYFSSTIDLVEISNLFRFELVIEVICDVWVVSILLLEFKNFSEWIRCLDEVWGVYLLSESNCIPEIFSRVQNTGGDFAEILLEIDLIVEFRGIIINELNDLIFNWLLIVLLLDGCYYVDGKKNSAAI